MIDGCIKFYALNVILQCNVMNMHFSVFQWQAFFIFGYTPCDEFVVYYFFCSMTEFSYLCCFEQKVTF